MKKFFAMFLALVMLVSMTAMFAVTASAEETSGNETEAADVEVKIYSVAGDPYVYLAFDKEMAVPAEDATVIFALCALGWPSDESNPTESLRDISRVEYTYQGMVGDSGKVMKFAVMANNAPSADHIPWGLGGLNINSENHVVEPHGGYWYYAFLGDQLTTADGTPAFDYELVVVNPDATFSRAGHMLAKTDASNSTFAVLTLSAVEDIPGVSAGTTEPAATEPAGTEPTDTEPAATEPTGTEPAGTEPADEEPASKTGLIIGIVAAVAVVAIIVVVVIVTKKK